MKKPGNDESLVRLRRLRGKLTTDFRFSRDEANDRSAADRDKANIENELTPGNPLKAAAKTKK